MKSIQVLVLFLIGMIGFTVTGATVTNPQQKQKTEFCKSVNVEISAVAFENSNLQSTLFIAKESKGTQSANLKITTGYESQLVIVADVGRKKEINKSTDIPRKEKLIGNSKHFAKYIDCKVKVKKPDNPFAVNQSFSFKRYC